MVFITAIYLAWVGYGAGIFSFKDILQMSVGALIGLGFTLYEDS